jgi:hypothetical protein
MQHSTAIPVVFPEPILPRLPSGKVDVEAWTKQQGVAPIQDPDKLAGGFWPEDESSDELIAARRQWREEGHSGTTP